ncbi:MAG TPA: LPS assembly protein LptD [Rhodocyclaceae bacterium]|jgi:LPS-assembly protein
MHRLPRGQFSILALLAAMGGVLSPVARGADLPPFAVDPVLLGLPAAKPVEPPAPAAAKTTAPAQVATPSSAPVTTPVVQGDAPPAVAASAPAPVVKSAEPPVSPGVATVAGSAAEEGKAVAIPRRGKKSTKKGNTATDVQTAAVPSQEKTITAAPAPVVQPASPAVATAPVVSPVTAPSPAPAPAVASSGVARNMTVFKVDPALLGLPADSAVTATAVARPAQTPAGSNAVAAQGVPTRPTASRKGGLVPGQVMPESAVVGVIPASTPVVRPAQGLAQGMAAFRVDPALLDPADRIAAPAAPVIAQTESEGKKIKKGPQPKLSIVPGVVAGGTYFPPVYAGSAKDRKTVPVYVTADGIEGTSGVQSIARGNADLIKADSRLRADEIIYREQEDEVEARGNVMLTREGDEVSGPHLKLKLGDSVGFFDSPTFKVDPRPAKPKTDTDPQPQDSITPPMAGYGTAARMDFLGEDHYFLSNATYSTCVPGESGQDWFAKVADLSLNYDTNVGEAHDATLVFKGMPILYSPWLSFSLNRQRKSGFLSPTWGSTSNGGMEFSIPYYWNIAPEMDATIAPRILAKRGTQWRGEYRYMGKDYVGIANGEYLPDDKITHTSRHAFSLQHAQTFSGNLSGNLNINGVSDDTYFTDMSSSVATVAQTNLVREGRLIYGGGWWNLSSLVQRYQTLQDPAQPPVLKPYERLPQIVFTASRPDLPLGLAFNFSGEYVSFSNPDKSLVQGRRTTAYPQLSLPLQTAAFYITPKIGVHNTRYQLDQTTSTGTNSLTRSVPIFSVDSGLVFERETSYFGRDMLQTLEPRLYYLRVPLRDQSQFPVFDTGVADFNFAQIFSENSFSGGDRIADANQTTLALSSRLISPNTGAELAKVAVGQRWYFSDQSVTLPGIAPRNGHLADYLGAVTAQLEQDTAIDGAIQYNPRDKKLERLNAGVRYQPETGRILNAGYRYSSTLLRQIDISGQWPLGGGWSGVGRFNYSLRDKRVVENIAGLEYNEACWALRFIARQVATATGQSSTGFFVQLQLNGFSSLGGDPVKLLRRSVSGYGRVIDSDEDEMVPR